MSGVRNGGMALGRIDEIAALDGVVAVAVTAPDGRAFRGDAVWHGPVRHCYTLLAAFPTEKAVQVLLGNHVIHVQRESQTKVAIVAGIADDIAASLHAIIRRADRGRRPVSYTHLTLPTSDLV